MNLLRLSWKNIIYKPSATVLSLVLFALGTSLIALLLLINKQLEDKFEKNQAGIDLVIGAKGSPLQLILCSMYHIDAPTGNINIADAKAFLRPGHPLIKQAVPLSLGDSYQGYRMVGTSPAIFDLYQASLATGAVWQNTLEVVAGAAAAEALHLKIGDTFKSAHGFVMDDDMVHEDAGDFRITGILKPTGAVIDQLLLTATQSVWLVHEHAEEEMQEPTTDSAHAEHHIETYDLNTPLHEWTDKAITSILIKYKNRNSLTLNMPRAINENTSMQAANPVWEINRLYSMLGDSALALQVLAIIIVIVSGLSVFLSLYAALRDRKYELALMRVMGASRSRLFALILLEGVLLAALGCGIGLALSHLGMEAFAGVLKSSYRYSFTGWLFLRQELWLWAGAIAIGFLAALAPAIQARNTDISETLAAG